jgi:ABC-type lipoprotein release transport system permease subunit
VGTLLKDLKHSLRILVQNPGFLTVALLSLASFWLTKLISGILFDVKAFDSATYGAVAVFLIAVALAACYFPARWATRIDPLEALRHE